MQWTNGAENYVRPANGLCILQYTLSRQDTEEGSFLDTTHMDKYFASTFKKRMSTYEESKKVTKQYS